MIERQPAPDFTRPFLVSLAPLVFIALVFVWMVWGLLAAMGVTYASDKAISRLSRR
ncbi:hypothetical protein ILP92_03445 [Maribius pontilimi]|uniref:Uncharacterized protein n=1 Tax=Palleronia pontilimi TaxID=1964209 RepID=A0A934IER0_9RHOB|nr:hypothetical protein [Palleronia pontilimi]MBJ3761802.1 hypothetical protein [Palleronia pontilimi]